MGRRFRRARFRDSTSVELDPISAGRGGYVAALLNVSADGLACQIRADTANDLPSGERVIARFRLAGNPTTFQIEARVVYNEDSSRRDHRRVGLQFSQDVDWQPIRQLLASVLESNSGASPRQTTRGERR